VVEREWLDQMQYREKRLPGSTWQQLGRNIQVKFET
jgi:hypothetical protein